MHLLWGVAMCGWDGMGWEGFKGYRKGVKETQPALGGARQGREMSSGSRK